MAVQREHQIRGHMKPMMTLGLSAVMVTSLGVAAAAAAPDATAVCRGVASDLVVTGNLHVPGGASCELSRVTVLGNTIVDGNLLVGESTIKGDTTVRRNGYLNSWGSYLGGNVRLNGAWGSYVDRTQVAGDFSHSSEGYPWIYTVASHVEGNYTVYQWGSTTLERTTVDKNLDLSSFDDVRTVDVEVSGDARVSARGRVDMDGTTVRGKASAVSGRSSLAIGKQKGNHFNDVLLAAAFAAEFSNNEVDGTADADRMLFLGGTNNRFRGTVINHFADCFPGGRPDSVEGERCFSVAQIRAGVAPTARAPKAKTDAASAKVRERSSQAKAQARKAGKAKLRGAVREGR